MRYLERVAEEVSQHLRAQDFEDAYGLATLVAAQEPRHALVSETTKTLDDYSERLIDQALAHARDGNGDGADAALAEAAALPGRDANYFSTVRASIADIQRSRRDSEQEKRKLAEQAATTEKDSRDAWLQQVRGAIAAGQLVSPPGNNARDYLAVGDAPPDLKQQLNAELGRPGHKLPG